MKKILKQFVVCMTLMMTALALNFTANAENFCPEDGSGFVSPTCKLQEVGEGTGLSSFNETGQHADAPNDFAQPGVGAVTSPIYFALDMLKLAMSSVAVLVVAISAVKLISTSEEEIATKVKNNLIMGVMGFLLIQAADPFVRNVFFGAQGEAFEDPGTNELFAEEGVTQIRGIIGLVQVFLGIVSILIIIIRGYFVLTSAGNDEALETAKRHITYAVLGLVAILMSEIVIRGVIFPQGGEALPDAGAGRKIFITVINYIASFVAIIAFAGLFFAAYEYITSGGNEEANENIKKVFINSIIGLLLALGAYAAVNTLLSFEEESQFALPAGEQPVENAPSAGIEIDN